MNTDEKWRAGLRDNLKFRNSFKIAEYMGNSFLVAESCKKDVVEGLSHIVDPIKNLARFRCERINMAAAEYATYTSYHISSYEQFMEDLNILHQYPTERFSEVARTLVYIFNLIRSSRLQGPCTDKKRIAFSDFLTAGNIDCSIIIAGLREWNQDYSLVMPTEASIVIYNVYTNFHRWLPCNVARVFWTNEMDEVDSHYANVSICPSNCFDSEPHVWYPCWLSCVKLDGMKDSYYGSRFTTLTVDDVASLVRYRASRDDWYALRDATVSVVMSNRKEDRLTIVKALEENGISMIKGGRCFDNPIRDKASFIAKADINMCFENTLKPGYITEKIIDSYMSGCVPLYWSTGINARLLNPQSYIEMDNFNSPVELANKIIRLTPNDLREMRCQPLFTAGFNIVDKVSTVGKLLTSLT
jgi:hypothetical protein